MSGQPSHLDYYVSDPAYAAVPKEVRTAGTNGLTLIRAMQPPGSYPLPAADDFTLQLVLSDSGAATVDHGDVFRCRGLPGALALSPAGVDLGYEVAGTLEHLIAVLPRQDVRALIEDHTGRTWSGSFGPLHTTLFEHDAIRTLLHGLWAEASSGSAHGALYADAGWNTILLGLLATSGQTLAPNSHIRGGLASWQERRTTEYLADNLAEDVTLDTLAGVAGLSTFHFARQFKLSTGLPPYAYLRRLRCERAKELLTGTDLPVTEIAAQVGYETPQASARMFRAEVGASPSRYRRERRS